MPFKNPEERKKYHREWVARRRADFFADKQCAICGSVKQLELDHIDPTKKADHRIWSWAKNRREAELEKCQILCHDCHLSKTFNDNNWGSHGVDKRYSKDGCRCTACKAAHAAMMRGVRARKKQREGP